MGNLFFKTPKKSKEMYLHAFPAIDLIKCLDWDHTPDIIPTGTNYLYKTPANYVTHHLEHVTKSKTRLSIHKTILGLQPTDKLYFTPEQRKYLKFKGEK